MSILAKILARCFHVLFGVFSRFVGIRTAIALAAWTTTAGLITALFASMYTCVTGVCADAIRGMADIAPYVAVGLGMVWNPTTISAFACYFTVWTLCQVYVVKKVSINMMMLKG